MRTCCPNIVYHHHQSSSLKLCLNNKMYPPVYNQPARYSTDSRFSTESHPGSTPVSGLPKPTTPQPYPPYMVSAAGMPSPCVAPRWSTGLCHCCDDPANCIITAFCPCITFGQIAEIVNEGSPSCVESGALYGLLLAVTGFACLYSCFYRSRLRSQYDLPEAPSTDCLVHFCCETCSLCQEYRELKARGYDMGIGNAFKDCFTSLDICSSSKP